MSDGLYQQLVQLKTEAVGKIQQTKDLTTLEVLRRRFLGKKTLVPITQKLAGFNQHERAELGRQINEYKKTIAALLLSRAEKLQKNQALKITKERLDITAPGIETITGTLHPITQVKNRVVEIFARMGFEYEEARLLDDDYHNFTSLNIPENHPARDLMDTFRTENNLVPISHTSSMQNRILKSEKPPIAKIIFGRCFRREATDPRHEHTFHQIEGIYVDRKAAVSDLIGTLTAFLESFFERRLKTRILPTYFPFVEPGLEFHAECVFCQNSKNCRTCGSTGFLELIPSGMIHPLVLKEGGLNPQHHSGFAWAIGLDRLAMLMFGIDDIRWFHSGDLRFLKQF